MESSTGRVIQRKEGSVGWITFDHPERLNAISFTMWGELRGMIADFEADTNIRAVALAGAGEKAFVAGADISQFEGLRSSSESRLAYDAAAETAIGALKTLTKPTIAMIRGYCIGAGVALALSCDLRICAMDARFAIPAAKLGLGYPFKNVESLVDVIGPAAAMQLLFTGRRFDAVWGLRVGLINEATAEQDLLTTTESYLDEISHNAPLPIRAAKLAVCEALKGPGERDLSRVSAAIESCFDSADYVEGRRAYMERRSAKFEGR